MLPLSPAPRLSSAHGRHRPPQPRLVPSADLDVPRPCAAGVSARPAGQNGFHRRPYARAGTAVFPTTRGAALSQRAADPPPTIAACGVRLRRCCSRVVHFLKYGDGSMLPAARPLDCAPRAARLAGRCPRAVPLHCAAVVARFNSTGGARRRRFARFSAAVPLRNNPQSPSCDPPSKTRGPAGPPPPKMCMALFSVPGEYARRGQGRRLCWSNGSLSGHRRRCARSLLPGGARASIAGFRAVCRL